MATYVGISIKPYNDIEIDETGNLVMVEDAEAVAQHARQRLSFFKGEWFLDETVGLDWFGVLGTTATSTNRAIGEALVKECILETTGVTGIAEISTATDRASRGLVVEKCVVETEFDETAAI